MRLAILSVFVCLIHAVTPHRTATNRALGLGDDSSVHLALHQGNIIYAKIAYHGKMHENKKNGGKTYTRWVNINADIPDDLDHVVFASMLVNMANPDETQLLKLAREAAMGMTPTLAFQGKDIVDYIGLNLPSLKLPFVSIDLAGLLNRASANFRNADGPVWFSSIMVNNPRAVGPGHVWDGSKTEAGLSFGAVYEVDWKVVKN